VGAADCSLGQGCGRIRDAGSWRRYTRGVSPHPSECGKTRNRRESDWNPCGVGQRGRCAFGADAGPRPLHCGYTMDFDGSTVVADAAKEYGFVNACAGKSVEDLPASVPLYIVRAGREQFAGLNETMDRFVAKALARNLPVTLVNHHTGSHTFDLDDDSEASREIIRQMLLFLQRSLSKP
jgi:hypothetical protein